MFMEYTVVHTPYFTYEVYHIRYILYFSEEILKQASML